MSWSLSNIDPVWFIVVLLLAFFVYYAARIVTGVLIKKGVLQEKVDWDNVLGNEDKNKKEEGKDGSA